MSTPWHRDPATLLAALYTLGYLLYAEAILWIIRSLCGC